MCYCGRNPRVIKCDYLGCHRPLMGGVTGRLINKPTMKDVFVEYGIVKRTSVYYEPVIKETPHGTAVIMHDAVYKKEKSGQLTRIDRKPKLGKAGRKAEKRAQMLERACQL